MVVTLNHHRLIALESMSPHDEAGMLANARMLAQVAASGGLQLLLKGKNLALLCNGDAEAMPAHLFRHAATELGAHVASVQPELTDTSTAAEVQHTARILGRLYDGVECQGMPASLVRRIAQDAGVPVFNAIASPQHSIAALAAQPNGEMLDNASHCRIVQAALLGILA